MRTIFYLTSEKQWYKKRYVIQVVTHRTVEKGTKN